MASMTYDRAKKAAEAATLEKRYRADHPKVVSAKAEIAVLDKAIEERRAQIATLGRTGALTQRDQKEEQSVDELKALLSKLQERKKALEAEALDLIGRIVKLGYLKEERLQARERLDETRRVLEEVRVESRNALPGVTEVVARGAVPDKPFEDKRKPMAMIGLFGGVGIGFALIALWGILRPTIRSEADLGALGKSVISAGSAGSEDEPVHKLRNTLHVALARHPAAQGRTIAVIGGGRSPGATALAHSLAKSFGEAGSRTALIDANLDNPELSWRLGMAEEPGISDWMTGSRIDGPHIAEAGPLTLLTAGTNRSVRDSALSPRDVGRMIEMLTATHDIVVSDCGGASRALSATLFSAQSDLVVLVLKRGVSLGEARGAVASILAASRRQILVVLTGSPARAVPGWISNAATASADAVASKFKKLRSKTGIVEHAKHEAEKAPYRS
jgi:tyrosine-protein kinase Etk/Wzc